jgi:CHAP domain-containing protein
MADIVSQGNDTLTALGAALNYTIGNCTRWVAENLPWIPAGLGNANQWLTNAQARGLPTIGPTSAPPIGSVAVFNTGAFGHVAEVVGQIPGGFQVSEENWLGLGRTDIRDVTGSALSGLQGFILPPGGASNLPVIGGLEGAASAALTTPAAIAQLPASVGHGLANAASATTTNIGRWFSNQLVPLIVALSVAIVLFGGDESQQ